MPKSLRKNKSKNSKSARSQKSRSWVFRFLLAILVFISTLFILYCFVLPSVIVNDDKIKNILIVSDNLDEQSNYISLVHLSQNHENDLMIFFDGKQMVEIDNEYGEYSLSSIYQLLKIDKKTDQKIKSVFSGVFNVVVNDIVVVNGINDEALDNKKLKTILFKNINDINTLKLYFLANSMEIIKFNQLSDIEKIYHKLSTVEKDAYQNCSVSVVNTTSETALAKKVSEIIENTGAQVVQVEGSSYSIEKTTIYYPDDRLECLQLINNIAGVFPVEPTIKSSTEIPSTQQFRSSVVIMIGSDY